MTASSADAQRSQKRIIIIGIIALAGLAFALVMAAIIASVAQPSDSEIDSQAYASQVALAMAGADASRGAELSAGQDCGLCHLEGDGRLAPLFTGLADLAPQRRPPLSAEQYLYEAVVNPAAHLVAGYSNAMPNNYGERLSQSEIGHIIAYLLTFTDEAGDA